MHSSSINCEEKEMERYQALLFAHGATVLLIALICGVVLIFSMLEGIILWPFLDIPQDIPGSVRGWRAAHVGGLTNGLLLIGMGVVLTKIPMKLGVVRFVFWSFILTAWGNTIFYLAGNFSDNRGISIQSNSYGESSIAGVVAYVGGGSAMLLTISATFLVAVAAFRHARTRKSQ